MAKFQVGDTVRDRHTYAEGIVTAFGEDFVTVEWLDNVNRLQVVKFNERRLLLIETAAAAGEGERVERRQVDDDEPERELRVTEPAPANGGVTVTVPEEVLDQLDDGVEAERERREFEGSTAEEDMDIAEEAAAPDEKLEDTESE